MIHLCGIAIVKVWIVCIQYLSNAWIEGIFSLYLEHLCQHKAELEQYDQKHCNEQLGNKGGVR